MHPAAPLTRVTTEGPVTVITLQNPPVNVLDRPLRRALLAALEDAEHASDVAAVVIAGDRTFCAGANLAEFDTGEALAEPSLHLTIAGFIDSMSKPVIAAIEGVALGGGLELALACHARVTTADAKLGLPETTLGFMPGAGGTQRLPRAVGLDRALDMIVTGKPVTGRDALEHGLVDVVVESGVTDAAVAEARRLAGTEAPLRRLRDVEIDDATAEGFLAFTTRTLAKDPRARRGTIYAVRAVSAACTTPFDEGLATEFRLFTELFGTDEARAARYRFAAERQAGREAAVTERTHGIHASGVIGAGTMGRGIALALAAAGIATTIVDTTQERVDAAMDWLTGEVARQVSRGRISAERGAAVAGRLAGATEFSAVADADLVIEAVFENLEVKKEVFARLDAVVRPDAVLASNTSSLDLDAIAAVSSAPSRVVGMHFFSPADVMPLVEVVEGDLTSAETLASVVAVTRAMRKIPVISQVGPGFIGNRIIDEYLRQAMILVSRGVAPARIDQVLQAWGMAMGPFAMLDLVGNDVPWLARRAAAEHPGPEWRLADELGERGWHGRKTGSGWYRYDEKKPRPNPDVLALIAEHLPEPVGVSDEEIVERCVYAMVNEAAAVLSAGVASRASDIDVVYLNGYGFPAGRGGPLFHAETVGLERVVRAMRRFDAIDSRDSRLGPRASAFWRPDPLLDAHVAESTPLTGRVTR